MTQQQDNGINSPNSQGLCAVQHNRGTHKIHTEVFIHGRQLEVTTSELYIVSRDNMNGKHPLLTTVTLVPNTSTQAHWLQCQNSDLRLTSVN